MQVKRILLVSCLLSALGLHAQAPSATPAQAPTAPATPTLATPAAPPTSRAPHAPQPPPSVVAGIPVNYDEAKVGEYTLIDPLVLNNGKRVTNAKTWWTKRRPEIEEIFETEQYGRDPGRPAEESFDVTDKGTPALNGKAIRKQVTISFSKDPTWPKIHLLIYLPAAVTKPVPMFFTINFGAIQSAVDDPGITPIEVWDPRTGKKMLPPPGRGFGRINVEPLLDAGFGVATYYYGEVDPDSLTGFPNGIRAKYLKPGQTERAPDDWGSIAAWAWGMSRVQDYFETDTAIDCKARGHSWRVAPGQDGDVGRSARPTLCVGDCKLLGRRWSGVEPSRLRRDNCAFDGADALSLSVRGELREVGRLS